MEIADINKIREKNGLPPLVEGEPAKIYMNESQMAAVKEAQVKAAMAKAKAEKMIQREESK